MHPENGERFAGGGLVVTKVAQDWPDCRSHRPYSPPFAPAESRAAGRPFSRGDPTLT